MVASGFDAWRVTHDWVDGESFEQDLIIKKVANAVDRVWFDTGAEMQDMSDAGHCWVMQTMTKDEYDEQFPDGSGQSVTDDRTEEVYSYKANLIVVGEFIYKKEVEKELVLMSNNAVYEVNDDFESVIAELAEQGITEVRRRKRKAFEVKTRLFDGGDWLNDEQDTVFISIPVVPTYANFQISENKVIYRGAVNKLMDAQRVYNYAQSRAIEEGALAPRGKYWVTREQAQSDMATLQTMNTNANPVQTYTHVEGQPPPFWQGGAQVNQGLQQSAADMSRNIIESSGVFAASQGDAPTQSGFAIELQQQKGDNATIKYFKSQEIAICRTARIIIDAIPKVYDTKRTVRILGEDGSAKMETINDTVIDEQTGQPVALNDLRKGKYDVVCDVGPAFRSRQQETARAFLEAAQIDPSLLQFAGDVWLNNLNSPGFDLIAERKRKTLFEAGAIPDSQMTDEEKEKAQQIIAQKNAEQKALQQQGPTVMEQAVVEQTQANTADIASRANERNAKIIQNDRKQSFEEAQFAAKLDNDEIQNVLAQQKQLMEQTRTAVEALNTQADTLKKMREAMGIDSIVGPHNTGAYINQARIVTESQESLAPGIDNDIT